MSGWKRTAASACIKCTDFLRNAWIALKSASASADVPRTDCGKTETISAKDTLNTSVISGLPAKNCSRRPVRGFEGMETERNDPDVRDVIGGEFVRW